MSIITKLKSEPAEIPKEDISNKRIPLEYFSIFSKTNPLDTVIGYLDSCQASAIITVAETPSKKKRKIVKKHSKRMALDNSVEQPNANIASPFARMIPYKSASFKTHPYFVDNISSLPSTTLISPTPNPDIFEQVHSEPAYTFKQVHFL